MNSYSLQASQTRASKPVYRLTATLYMLFMLLTSAAKLQSIAQAQAPPPITASGGLNTHVNLSSDAPIGKVQYDITGGTRAGSNVFHSFGDFSIPNSHIANFLNDTGLTNTTHILGRVTGGNVSTIFGTLQTTGFGQANLFLMNPAGIVFGPHASLNVGGSVSFATADYITLADGVRFNAIPNVAADSLLSAAPISTFGFISSAPAAISSQGSTLIVRPKQSLSLVGGNREVIYTHPDTEAATSIPSGVTVTAGRLSAPGGQINIASVASSGEVSAADFMQTPSMTMGDINFSQAATLSVSGKAAGTVRIRGGQLVITDATISANTRNANGAPIAIDIMLTKDLSVTDTRGAATITAKARDSGDAGEVHISAANITITSTSDSSFAAIDTHTLGSGKGGDVTIAAPGTLTVTGVSN
ncbi:MAG: filamentous hemagglutinin N-terminal domain-containing protein, partial [Nitrospira sp.]